MSTENANPAESTPSYQPTENYTPISNTLIDYWLPIIGVNATILYILLCCRYDARDGYAQVSRKYLLHTLGVSANTFQKARRTLEEHDLLAVKAGGRAHLNKYIPKPLDGGDLRPRREFIKVDNNLIDWLPVLGVNATILYITLYRLYNDGAGFAWPSLPYLETKIHRTGRTIQKARRTLESYGLLVVRGNAGRVNQYNVLPVLGAQNNTGLPVLGAQNNTAIKTPEIKTYINNTLPVITNTENRDTAIGQNVNDKNLIEERQEPVTIGTIAKRYVAGLESQEQVPEVRGTYRTQEPARSEVFTAEQAGKIERNIRELSFLLSKRDDSIPFRNEDMAVISARLAAQYGIDTVILQLQKMRESTVSLIDGAHIEPIQKPIGCLIGGVKHLSKATIQARL